MAKRLRLGARGRIDLCQRGGRALILINAARVAALRLDGKTDRSRRGP